MSGDKAAALHEGRQWLTDEMGTPTTAENSSSNLAANNVVNDRSNSFGIWIFNNKSENVGKIIAHEKGHIFKILSNPTQAWKDKDQLRSLNCQDNPSNSYAIDAIEAQNAYMKLPQTYSRQKFVKPSNPY